MNLVVSGSREWKGGVPPRLGDYLRLLSGNLFHELVVWHGDCRGIDKTVATEQGFYEGRSIPADWNRHGKPAGMIRNSQLVKLADATMAYPRKGGTGTQDVITKTLAKGIPMIVHWV